MAPNRCVKSPRKWRNREMAYWSTTAEVRAPQIELHEIERRQQAAQPIRLRDLLAKKAGSSQSLVPKAPYRYLQHYNVKPTTGQQCYR